MRIGIDATALPRRLAGAGHYIIGLVGGLADLGTQHEFLIYCKTSDACHFSRLPCNFTLRTLPDFDRTRRLFWQLYGLRRWLSEDKLDVWHATHYVMPAFRSPTPVVATIHDLAFYHFPHFYDWRKGQFFRWAIAHAVRNAHACVAVSASTRRDIEQFFPEAGPAHMVHSGIRPIFFQPRNGTLSPHPRPYVLAIGTQEKRKNLPMLVRVFAKIAAEFPEVDLVLVGQPENDSPAILRECREHGLADRVSLAGYVSEERLLSYYQHALLFCQPSHYEGFGFPVLEAMAAEVPVLVSDRPAMAEIAAGHVQMVGCQNERGWQNAIRDMLQAPASAENRRLAKIYAQRFAWRETARRMVSIYESLAPKRPTVPRNTGRPQLPYSADLPEAVLRTLAYADLFDYPLTARELHRGLLAHRASEDSLSAALQRLWRRGMIGRAGGYYFLPGRDDLPTFRKQRECNTQRLLRQNRRLLALLGRVPFVRGVALSGSAAFGNCHARDDIDLFLLCRPGRLWVVYSFLVILLKILRRRSVLCLNYLVADQQAESLAHDIFTAYQIVNLRPLAHAEVVVAYQAHHHWVRRFFPQWSPPEPAGAGKTGRMQRAIELLFGARIFDILERAVYTLYRKRILALAGHFGPEKVLVNEKVIRLFTNDHHQRVMRAFSQRCAEVKLQDMAESP